MRNFFSYLRRPESSTGEQLHTALKYVPQDEFDIHHVLSDEECLTHYKRVHLQCTAMAVLLANTKDDDILDEDQWRNRLTEFDAPEDQIELN